MLAAQPVLADTTPATGMCKDKSAIELVSRVLREQVLPLQGRVNPSLFRERTSISDNEAMDYNAVRRIAVCQAMLYTYAPKGEVDLDMLMKLYVDYRGQSNFVSVIDSRFTENGERLYGAQFSYTVQVTGSKQLLVAVTKMHDADARMSAAILLYAADQATSSKRK